MIKCRALVSIGDDQGDNSCTFHCNLESGHSGGHSESFKIGVKSLTMTWDGGEKVELAKYCFKISRCKMDFETKTEGALEELLTPVMSESEAWDAYGTGGWMIHSFEQIEDTKAVALVYEDEII